MLVRFIALFTLSLFLFVTQNAYPQENTESSKNSLIWDIQNKLPDLKESGPQLGLAGARIGISNDRLIVAGGANFPNGLPWKGGKKASHRNIYVAKMVEENKLEWESVYPLLPAPLAYSANVNYQNGFISVGGENGDGAVTHVSYWEWNEGKRQLIKRKLPDLPLSLTNTTTSILNNHLYVMGGENQDGVSNAVWMLNLLENRSR